MSNLATLGGLPLVIDPTSVDWSFQMKVAEHSTLGGKVLQIFGTTLGDMTLHGVFGAGDKAKGEEAGWEAQQRWVTQIQQWATNDTNSYHPVPLRFLYPSKGWDFKVFVKAFASEQGEFEHANENFNPTWVLTLFIVQDSTQVVVKGIQDAYISRLMNGIGWKQTKYNGLSSDEVDALLSPYNGSAYDYLRDQALQAIAGTASNPTGAIGGG